MATFTYSDPFTPVKTRKKRNNRRQPEHLGLYDELERAKLDLLQDDWRGKCQHMIKECTNEMAIERADILCLGLGSPECSREARAQLAYLLHLRDEFSLHEENRVSLYDPVFTTADIELLGCLQLDRLLENSHGKHTIDRPTILYMPHCDIELYENILRANWSKERLSKIFFIANNFLRYLESKPMHKMKKDFPCLLKLAPLLKSRPLPASENYLAAFIDLSAQYLAPVNLAALPPAEEASFWDLTPITNDGLSIGGANDTLTAGHTEDRGSEL